MDWNDRCNEHKLHNMMFLIVCVLVYCCARNGTSNSKSGRWPTWQRARASVQLRTSGLVVTWRLPTVATASSTTSQNHHQHLEQTAGLKKFEVILCEVLNSIPLLFHCSFFYTQGRTIQTVPFDLRAFFLLQTLTPFYLYVQFKKSSLHSTNLKFVTLYK